MDVAVWLIGRNALWMISGLETGDDRLVVDCDGACVLLHCSIALRKRILIHGCSKKSGSSYLSRSKSQRLKTSSKTDRFLCGKREDNISMAFWDTSGDLEVEDGSCFLIASSLDLFSGNVEVASTVLGSVTVIPKIFPGGRASIVLPVSVDASRSAIASSTACCRFNATCELIEGVNELITYFCVRMSIHEILQCEK